MFVLLYSSNRQLLRVAKMILIMCPVLLIHANLSANAPGNPTPYTHVHLNGNFPDNLSISYTISGLCAANTQYIRNQKAWRSIPINLQCHPESYGDTVFVNIVKPKGYNIRSTYQNKHNDPGVGNMLVKITSNEPVTLILNPLEVVNVFYIDFSNELDKMTFIQTLIPSLDSIIQVNQKFLVFASNDQTPLLYSSEDYLKSSESKNIFLNRLAFLNNTPPFGKDDALLLQNILFDPSKNYDIKYINLFYYSSITNNQSWNQLLIALLDILPLKNQGTITLFGKTQNIISDLNIRTKSRIRRNDLIYVSF